MKNLLVLFILLAGCTSPADTICDETNQRYPINYISQQDFDGCLFANSAGEMMLVSRDSIQPILHPLNGNYSNPISVENYRDIYKYKFQPIHNRKLFQVTGKNGLPEEKYELQLGEETIQFIVKDPKQINLQNISIFNPDWKAAAPDTLLLNKKNTSMEISGFEMVFSGINMIIHPYLESDSLYVNLKVINRSLDHMLFSPPKQIDDNLIMAADSTITILRGERFNSKFVFQAKDQRRFYLDKKTFKILADDEQKAIFNKNIPLVEEDKKHM